MPARGPRSGTAWLSSLVDADPRAALSEFEGDCKTDQPGADDDDVAVRSVHHYMPV